MKHTLHLAVRAATRAEAEAYMEVLCARGCTPVMASSIEGEVRLCLATSLGAILGFLRWARAAQLEPYLQSEPPIGDGRAYVLSEEDVEDLLKEGGPGGSYVAQLLYLSGELCSQVFEYYTATEDLTVIDSLTGGSEELSGE